MSGNPARPFRGPFKNRAEAASLAPNAGPRDTDGKGHPMKHLSTLVAGALTLMPLGAQAEETVEAGIRWAIVAVSGTATLNEPEILFEASGRVSGTSGCNRFGGEVTQAEGILTLGPLASTRMACPGELGAQEQAIFALLGQPLGVDLDLASDRVTLTAPDGGTLALRRQP